MTNAHSIDLSKIKQVKKDGRKGGNRKPVTNEQFIAKARKKHGNRYSYSKTHYKHSQEEIIITCRLHGDFTQVATTHLRSKHGCQECGKESGIKAQKKDITHFLIEAKKVHGSKYDYSKTKYKSSAELVVITCPTHGDFERTPNSHLHGGYGCNECAGISEIMRTTSDFISKAVSVHGDTYSYENSKFKGGREKVEIFCKQHGYFYQSVYEHLKGAGCQDCGKIKGCGYSRRDFIKRCKSGLAKIYVIKCFDKKETFYKVGITSNDLKTRFRNTRSMPYGYATQYEIESDAGYIYDLEVRLHSLLKNKSYEPDIKFRGYTECFTTIKPIEQLLKELSNTDQLQLIA